MKPNILVVDDETANLVVLVSMLEGHGYIVRPAISGKLALDAARKKPPDAILLDIMMPDMNGFEVCTAIKANDALKNIPVIFLSALQDTKEKIKAFEVGGVDYIAKPYQDTEVLARVKTHLALHNAQTRLKEQNVQLEQKVAERRRTEQVLQSERDLLNTILVTTNAQIVYFDRNFNFGKANPAYIQTCGYSWRELQGRNHFTFFPNAENQRIFEQVRDTGQSVHFEAKPFEYANQPERGVTYWDWTLTPVKNSDGQVQGLVFSLLDVTERVRMEAQLQQALKEKIALLQEIHHRVKNNLQVVSSLLYLQADATEHAETRKILEENRDRIMSMALVHEQLYASNNLANIQIADYIQELTTHLYHSYRVDVERIRLKLSLEPLILGIEQAIPCGLLIQEILSNAIKHAFPDGQDGTISITFGEYQNGFRLIVENTGVPFPRDIDIQRIETMGLDLIRTFTHQLRGTLEFDRSAATTFTITFPKR